MAEALANQVPVEAGLYQGTFVPTKDGGHFTSGPLAEQRYDMDATFLEPVFEEKSSAPSLTVDQNFDEGNFSGFSLSRRVAEAMSSGDEGLLVPAVAIKIFGVAAVAATVGASFGMANFLRNMDLTHDTFSMMGGKGTVVRTYSMKKECNSGFVTNVEGAKAEFNKKFKGPISFIPTTDKVSEELNAGLSAGWCHGAMQVQRGINENTKKVVVEIPASSYYLDIKPVNPVKMEENFKDDNGLYQALKKNFANELNVLPGVDAQFGAGLPGRLRGYAYLYASRIVSNACAPKVKPLLVPIEKQSVAEQIASEVSQDNPRMAGITAQDVTVRITGNIGSGFGSEYDKTFAKLKKELSGKDVSFSFPADKQLHCALSPALKAEKAQLAGTNTAAPTPSVTGSTNG